MNRPNPNHPAPYALINRLANHASYHWEWENALAHVRGNLSGDISTNFDIFMRAGDEWEEVDLDPYDYFATDELDYRRAHLEFLEHLPDADPRILWRIAEGDRTAIRNLSQDEQVCAEKLFDLLESDGEWGDSEDEWIAEWGLTDSPFFEPSDSLEEV